MPAQADPAFHVGPIPIKGDLILSPMDGISDWPFRSLARALGSAMSYTEFINAQDVLHGHPHLEQRLAFTEDERPVVFQLFDDEPARLLEAALRLRERGPDIIDINMGCSARTVAGRGAGAGLLCHPGKIAQIFASLSRALDIPVTGKIRLGWDEGTRNAVEVARIIEENGGQLVAVHGRTRRQGYTGQADWHAIAAVRQAVGIPVLANGDVRTPADIAAIQAVTGCPGVLIGRAAIGNPWIFQRVERAAVPTQAVRRLMAVHLERMLRFYGAELGLVLFRKHASRYISPYPLPAELRLALLTASDAAAFERILNQALAHAETQPTDPPPGTASATPHH